MSFVALIVAITLLGLFVWAITTLVPLPPPFRTAIYVISVIVLVLIVLSAFGLTDALNVRVPQLR